MSDTRREWLMEAVIDEAVEWFSRHRSGDSLRAAEKEAFLAWLRASPQHVHGYLEVTRVAKAIPEALVGLELEKLASEVPPGNVVPFPPLSTEWPNGKAGAFRSNFRSGGGSLTRIFVSVAAIVLASLVALLTGDVPQESWLRVRVISAPPLRVQLVQLGDGSTVYLRGGAEIGVRYTPRLRSVELIHGQALFEVVRNAARPFRVQAGAAEVIDVGTRFDVSQESGRTTVTVLEGRVDVLPRRTARAASAGAPVESGMSALPLTAGEQVQIGYPAITPHVTKIDLQRVTAWMHRDIRFKNRPLQEVIEQINRYTPVPVRIEDPALRSLRVNGVLDAYDSASLLLFLAQYGQIERTGQGIDVRSPVAASQEHAIPSLR